MSSSLLVRAVIACLVTWCSACPVPEPRCAGPTSREGARLTSIVEMLGHPSALDGCRIRTAGYLDVGEGARLFLSEEDLKRFNAFNAVAVRVPLVEDGATARIAPPLGGSITQGALVLVDGIFRRGDETEDPRIEAVTAIAPYGKPVGQR